MKHGYQNKKLGVAAPSFTRLLGSAFASYSYRIGLESANACLPFLPVAVDGARYGAALLWGGLQ